VAAGAAASLPDGVKLGAGSIDGGAARGKLADLVAASASAA
jgi:hypothetical protein